MEATFTIKNYRCFEDKHHLEFTIKNGFTALIGPNNSGKSALLKFFYEFRELWTSLSNIQGIFKVIRENGRRSVALNGLYDPQEIFTDNNERELTIEIKFAEALSVENQVHIIKIEINKANPIIQKISFFYGPDKRELKEISTNPPSFGTTKLYDVYLNKNADFKEFMELTELLSKCLYIGPFRNAINEGSGNYYDLNIGTSFIDVWNQWKTGNIKQNNKKIQDVIENIRKIFNFRSLEINSSKDLKTLQVYINGNPYKLNELGSGLSQFIIVLGNAAIRNPSFILIDEPEINLHPSLQIDFLTTLASYSREGIIFGTHSIGLARSVSDQIYSFTRKEDYSEVRPFEQTNNYCEFIGEMSYASYKELGFNKILLVEGVKDVKAIQQFLRKIKKEQEIVIIPLGGSQFINENVEMELNELKRISDNIYCIIDSEKAGENNKLDDRHIKFKEICDKLKINLLITERRAIEHYFTENAIKKLRKDYKVLNPYEDFESVNPRWNKTDNWRIAREMDWNDIKGTDLGKFIDKL